MDNSIITNEEEFSQTKLSYKDLPEEDQIRLVFDYFTGQSKKEIIKNFNEKKAEDQAALTLASLNSLIDTYRCNTTQETNYKILQLQKARESTRISEIKSKVYNLIEDVIVDVSNLSNKTEQIQQFSKIKDVLSEIDKIQRLNNDESTQNVKVDTTHKVVDINKVLQELPTTEDKLRFLQKRVEYDRDPEDNS